MLIPRQTYVGRVIAPARFFDSKKTPFITFVLAVNGLASAKDENNRWQRTSAKITCSYSVKDQNDLVATILSRIYSEENQQTLAGNSYKSVLVAVEGTERLVHVQDKDGGLLPGYYKNLDFCSVSILDSNVLDLYKKEFAKEDKTENSNRFAAKKPVNTNQPNLAPKSQPKQEAVVEGYEIGDILTDPEGQDYEYLGGDAENMDNWRLVVKEVPTPEKKVPPFLKKNTAKPAITPAIAPTVAKVLEDGEEEPSLFDVINGKDSPI